MSKLRTRRTLFCFDDCSFYFINLIIKQVQIGGKTITSNLDDTFKLLGYCPQHDALWKDVTVREHLRCYAAIRGVHPSKIPGYVSSL